MSVDAAKKEHFRAGGGVTSGKTGSGGTALKAGNSAALSWNYPQGQKFIFF